MGVYGDAVVTVSNKLDGTYSVAVTTGGTGYVSCRDFEREPEDDLDDLAGVSLLLLLATCDI